MHITKKYILLTFWQIDEMSLPQLYLITSQIYCIFSWTHFSLRPVVLFLQLYSDMLLMFPPSFVITSANYTMSNAHILLSVHERSNHLVKAVGVQSWEPDLNICFTQWRIGKKLLEISLFT